MAPQWMPQNIQKRLLLYVLQQLSLFSEIDLPNLDVSLGSNSQITLTDVELDTDAFQIPGLYLRSGTVQNLKLQLNMSDGVNIEGDGLSVTIALASPAATAMTQSDLHSDKSKFSLAQSTLDLANSIMTNDTPESIVHDSHESFTTLQTPETEQAPQSTLNSMMAKAVEVALAKLNVTLKNINVRAVLDHATVDLHIEKASFITVDGVRSIDLSEISVIGVHPELDPGERGTQENAESELPEEDKGDDFCGESDEDSDDDGNYEGMDTSSIFERPSDAEKSTIHDSKVTESSIYMSATSQLFESRRQELISSTKLLFITQAKVTFLGSSKLEDLTIDIDEVRIPATPLPQVLLHIIESLGVLKSTNSRTRYSNISQKLKEQKEKKNQQHNKEDQKPMISFKSLNLNKLIIDFASALSESGEFCLETSLRLVCERFVVQRKDSNLIYGNLSKLYLIDNGKRVGGFDGDETRFDIRFDYKISTGEFTVLLPKNLEVNLEKSSLQRFINITSYLPQILESLKKLGPTSSPASSSSKRGSVAIQTSLITVNLSLSSEVIIKLKVAPISYSTTDATLSASKVNISHVVSGVDNQFLTVTGLTFQAHQSEKQVRSYDNTGHEIVLSTASSLLLKNVELLHDCKLLSSLSDASKLFFDALDFSKPEPVFKHRKKTRASSNVTFQARQSANLFLQVGSFSFRIDAITEAFGDFIGSFSNIAIVLQKDSFTQFHVLTGSIARSKDDVTESFFEVINPDDKSVPILSAKTKNFKEVNISLRNVCVDYYTKWISLFDDGKSKMEESSEIISASVPSPSESKVDLKVNLVECGIGLNPGRLKSKAVLVIPLGNLEVSFGYTQKIKADIRVPVLVLIDDVSNILSHNEAKKNRNIKTSWSQAAFYKTKGFVSVAGAQSLKLSIIISQSVGTTSRQVGKHTLMDIEAESLSFELCADSSQCLLQLVNDLKQPIVINPESKYRISRSDGINVFDSVEENAFNEASTIDNIIDQISTATSVEPLNLVDSYYDRREDDYEADILDRDLSEMTIKERNLDKNPFYTGSGNANDTSSNSDFRSENSDSIILFNDGHFEETTNGHGVSSNKMFPFLLNLVIDNATVKIYDGYDWKYTRRSISNAISRLEKKVKEFQMRPTTLKQNPRSNAEDSVESLVGETLFDSIHVAFPVTVKDVSELKSKINKDIQNSDDTVEVGRNNIKKLKLRRSKAHKILIELKEIDVSFTLFSNQDPLTADSKTTNSEDFELVNEVSVKINDFEVTDNVPTSTWNKFATLLKEVERESGSYMLNLKMKTIRPVLSLAATEILLDVEVLPLRLHVDQDTLEVLTRFGEFKDSRFLLIDEFEDIAYIQKFHVNAVRIKLDYKPKKIDYAGLRSGRTTEFMNFFILDEASMVLKEVTLYGVSGFSRLGLLLNGLWMPDVKQTQLSGVLAGLAPVRSIVQIGSGFKDLVVVPIQEYKKDGRVYRSLSKGVQQFTKNTTNELLKFGIKLAAGTQALLENTEEALGGVGSSARLPVDRSTIQEEYEDEDADDWDLQASRFGGASQLIGRSAPSSQQPLHRSLYHPTLESMIDINESPYPSSNRSYASRRGSPKRLVRQRDGELEDYDEEDEAQRTISLYANQPRNLREGLLLAYDSLGRNFLVAKDAIINAGSEISESGSAHETTLAVVKATPVALIRPMIGATEAASRALLGINNQFDPNQKKYIDDKYKQIKK